MSSQPGHTNRLIHETSPYLLQHAHNPVDWYPWGPEAFAAARQQDKPIFLSVGYSTCYWCHVMERESFENPAIAAEMNRRFICIKVDREERPDVDQLYMLAVQILTQHGGWPMSVFLTPDLRPFHGGTYFPPDDSHGRPGLRSVLIAIEDAYRHRKPQVDKTANQVVGILRRLAEPAPLTEAVTLNDDVIESLLQRSTSDYDPRHGGFGSAPKFPRQTLLQLLLVHGAIHHDPQREKMLRHTLDRLAQGGIRDQIGGAFHRYSTDSQWLIPHFEIMLYDNAMLAWAYVEAFRQFHEDRFARVARGILDFILREMTSPEGAFYTAFDAETDAREGLTYLWKLSEIESLLSPDDAKLFARVYGLDRGPNFADPHHGDGRPDHNILHLPIPLSQVAADMGITEADLDARLDPLRQILYTARRRRKQPLLDTKILTSWNALAIRAFAYAGQILQEPRYLDAASGAASFLLAQHRGPGGGLYRSSRDGKKRNDGFLDDYAFLAQSLSTLHEATGIEAWREHADSLVSQMRSRFADPAGAFYFTQADAPDLLVRQKVSSDSPLPSGNAVAALVLMSLERYTEARTTLALFVSSLVDQPDAMSSMLEAAFLYVQSQGPLELHPQKAPPAPERPLSLRQLAADALCLRAQWANPTRLDLHIDIPAGVHINANQAAQGLIPTMLHATGAGASQITSFEYPRAELQSFAFADAPIPVYSGQIAIEIRFSAPYSTALDLRLALSYQACSQTECLPQITRPVDIPIPGP